MKVVAHGLTNQIQEASWNKKLNAHALSRSHVKAAQI
jgi:hypothetical protein